MKGQTSRFETAGENFVFVEVCFFFKPNIVVFSRRKIFLPPFQTSSFGLPFTFQLKIHMEPFALAAGKDVDTLAPKQLKGKIRPSFLDLLPRQSRKNCLAFVSGKSKSGTCRRGNMANPDFVTSAFENGHLSFLTWCARHDKDALSVGDIRRVL
jgi:hypothetical protein